MSAEPEPGVASDPEAGVAAEPGWYRPVGLVVLTGCGLLSGVLELLFIPLYAGTWPVPVAIAGAVAGNVLLPYLARELGFGGRLAALPFFTWLAVMLVAVLLPRPEGDVVVPGGSLTWVSYGVLFGGAIAGTLTLVITSSPPVRTVAATPSPRPVPPAAAKPRPRPRPKR